MELEEQYKRLGISGKVLKFGREIERSLRERFDPSMRRRNIIS